MRCLHSRCLHSQPLLPYCRRQVFSTFPTVLRTCIHRGIESIRQTYKTLGGVKRDDLQTTAIVSPPPPNTHAQAGLRRSILSPAHSRDIGPQPRNCTHVCEVVCSA